MQDTTLNSLTEKTLFDPTYLNIEYLFNKILEAIKPIIAFLTDSHFWNLVGIVSGLLSIFFISIIIYCLVRMNEIQDEEKGHIDHAIHESLHRKKEKESKVNPRWHYIMTLIESPNESDWRVGIIEADSMLEEIFRDKGFQGETMNDLLQDAKNSGVITVQNAWDAHLIRNKIAHEGSEFPLSQVEARRVGKLFQNVFEELGVHI